MIIRFLFTYLSIYIYIYVYINQLYICSILICVCVCVFDVKLTYITFLPVFALFRRTSRISPKRYRRFKIACFITGCVWNRDEFWKIVKCLKTSKSSICDRSGNNNASRECVREKIKIYTCQMHNCIIKFCVETVSSKVFSLRDWNVSLNFLHYLRFLFLR